MILLILKMVLLTVIWTMGWKVVTSEGMLLENVGKWGEQMVKKYKIFDGLIICPWCIPNIHGLFIVWPLAIVMGVMPLNMPWWKYVAMYPFCACAACFISGIVWDMYLTLNRKREYYDNAQKHYYLLNKKQKDEKQQINKK